MTADSVGTLQVLSKTMDSTTLSPEKIELSTVRRDEDNDEVNSLRVDFKRPMQLHVSASKACSEAEGVKKRGWRQCWTAVNKVVQLRTSGVSQVMFHIYEDAELKPLLDAVNDEREKEKEKENEG